MQDYVVKLVTSNAMTMLMTLMSVDRVAKKHPITSFRQLRWLLEVQYSAFSCPHPVETLQYFEKCNGSKKLNQIRGRETELNLSSKPFFGLR